VNIAKYFWDLNENALKGTKKILNSPEHPKFAVRMVTLLSRCEQPKEVFTLLSKKRFIESWPRARAYWLKIEKKSDFRDWWQTIYEQILQGYQKKERRPQGKPPALFSKVGKMIKDERLKKALSQRDLAMRIGMKQPDISSIEEGKKNITLETLARISRALEIKRIAIDV